MAALTETGYGPIMTPFADTLKTWRKARRFSQLELALEAEVSARHISFLETGRARPSPEMIGRLGEALALPLSARNQLLIQAGFAARYPRRDWSDAALAPIRAAIDHMLAAHAPYPALALDRLWRVQRLNPPAAALFGALGLGDGDDLLSLLCSEALPPVVENWPAVAAHSAHRLRLESAAQGGVAALDAAAAHLSKSAAASDAPLGPVTPTILRLGRTRLALFSTIAHFGTPEDVALDDLRIELFFPADPETEATLRRD